MAVEGPQFRDSSITAAIDLSAKQFYFVKLTGVNNREITLCAGATDKPYGVLQNTPKAGETATVAVFGETKIVAAAATTAGASIGTNASGKAAVLVQGTDTTKYVVGVVKDGVANADSYITAWINCPSAGRGA